MGNSSFFFPVQVLIMQKLTDNQRLYQVSYPSSALACRRQNRPSLHSTDQKGLSGLALNLKHLMTARAQRGTLPNGCASAVPLCLGCARSRHRFLHARTQDVEGISRPQWYPCVSYRWNMWTMAAKETKRRFLVRWSPNGRE